MFVLWSTRTGAFILSEYFAKTLDFSYGNRQAFGKRMWITPLTFHQSLCAL